MQDINKGSKIEYNGKVADKPTKEIEEEIKTFKVFEIPSEAERNWIKVSLFSSRKVNLRGKNYLKFRVKLQRDHNDYRQKTTIRRKGTGFSSE